MFESLLIRGKEGDHEWFCGEKVYKNSHYPYFILPFEKYQTFDEPRDLSEVSAELQLKRLTVKGYRLLLIADF